MKRDGLKRVVQQPRTTGVTGRRAWTVWLAVGLAWLSLPPVVRAAADDTPCSEWCPDVADVLYAYRAGDYTTARRLCAPLLEKGRDARVRRDALALQAMTLARSPARSDQWAGVTQLERLAQEQPALLERPECNLALGIAHTGLKETAAALERLDAAAAGFAACGQHDRLGAALLALAEAWARHTEWEVTPPRFAVGRPGSSAEARQVRREQIGRIRARLAQVPNSADALAQVDLLLAEDFIAAGDRAADGLRALEQIAAAAQITPAVAEAMLKLARHHEQERQWSVALALYRRLAAEGPPSGARQAERRIAEITEPDLSVDAPRIVACGQRLRVNLQVRNVAAVQVEVRRVALRAWLESRQRRFAEALLPVAGSLELARRLDTRVEHEYDWWTSAVLAEPLELQPPPGAYVVIASTADRRERPEMRKRLVIVSDLTVAMVVGQQRGVVWAAPRSPSVNMDEARAYFWMFGSFVPTQPRLEAGVSCFALPPEARVMRDRRWVCLVEAGEHLALCQGRLRSSDQTRRPALVALVGDRSAARVGATVRLAGLALPAPGQTPDSLQPATWQLELRDVLDEVLVSQPLDVPAAGIFATDIPITKELGGKHLHVVLREDNQVVENVGGRFAMKVAQFGAQEFVVVCRVPRWLPGTAKDFAGRVEAWYPWGTPVAEGELTCSLHAVGLPGAGNGYALVPGATYVVEGDGYSHHDVGVHLDEAGGYDFSVPTGYFALPKGPAAIETRAQVNGWEGLEAAGFGQTLWAAEPVHAWLQAEPAAPRAGQSVCFELGWFDPSGQAGIEWPHVELSRDGQSLTELELHLDAARLKSDPWMPPAAGTYEAVGHLPRWGAEPLRVSRTIEVGAGEGGAEVSAPRVSCAARFSSDADRPGVQVRLEGRLLRWSLVVVEAGDPLVARTFEGLDGAAEVFLPLDGPVADTRVLVVTGGPGGLEVVAQATIEPAPAQAIELEVQPPAAAPLPGVSTKVAVTCRRAGVVATDAMLLARLVPATDSSGFQWQLGETRALPESAPSQGSLVFAWAGPGATGEVEPAAAGGPAESRLPPALWEALMGGPSLWATALPVGANTELSAELPDTPGLYRLILIARTPAGAVATREVVLDTRAGLRVVAEAPARSTLGDRFLVGIALDNDSSDPVEVGVSLDPGDGLQLEEVQLGKKAIAPARGRAWLPARVEAAAVGESVLTVSVTSARGVQTATADYEVLPAELAATAEPTLRIKRSLLLLTPEPVLVDPITGELSGDGVWKTLWQRTEFCAGDALRPGQHLLLCEELESSQALDTVTWSQRVPPNCHARLGASQARQTVGQLEACRADEVCHTAPTLAAGQHTQQTHLVAVRPGVCVLPWPELREKGQQLNVTVEPAEMRLNVIDARSTP